MKGGLFGLFDREQRSLEDPGTQLTDSALLSWLGGAATDAGVSVSEQSALRMPAVWRSVTVIAGVSSSLPLPTFKAGTRTRTVSPLLEDPHPELTRLEVWRYAYLYRVLWGNAYIQKLRAPSGQVKELWPISANRVQVDRERPSEGNPTGKWFWVTDDWGVTHRLTPRDVLHIPGLGYDGLTGVSPVRLASQGIGLAQAAEKGAARLFGSGNMIGGVLQTEQRLNPDQANDLKERWKAKMSGVGNSHEVAVLDSGASFNPVAMPNTDAQFLESREFQNTEIARMFGVPLFLLMETSKSTSWGTGLEQQATGWVKFDLAPTWLAPTEQRITKELLSKAEYAKYQVAGLLRGDSSARATFYRAMRDTGVMSANDIRELEDLPPIPGPEGDVYLQPTFMAPLGSNPLADAATPAAVQAARHLAEAHRLLTPPTADSGGDDVRDPDRG
ncbi:phage portal protein [Streptomyces rubiginosohelvolus]|uniref:Phage portal protein n=1 Tax=Streptomyces rubiginosohelvolus TaxID=67362 RepID=A0ABQ3BPG0_9ACTN|nr:phage portal protein [Streptomyces pluricolorescens]GGZ53210.1 phage portal protein [Streptomyces pluricolorescens]